MWPFDFKKFIDSNNKDTKTLHIAKIESERALLCYLVAQIAKIDPDIIVGHDISGFDLDVLLHRTILNKIPMWSKLGRLNRSQPPTIRGKMAEKQAVTGRLVCDLKISAKELIR